MSLSVEVPLPTLAKEGGVPRGFCLPLLQSRPVVQELLNSFWNLYSSLTMVNSEGEFKIFKRLEKRYDKNDLSLILKTNLVHSLIVQ